MEEYESSSDMALRLSGNINFMIGYISASLENAKTKAEKQRITDTLNLLNRLYNCDISKDGCYLKSEHDKTFEEWVQCHAEFKNKYSSKAPKGWDSVEGGVVNE